jgi:hypothetical protein
MAKTREITLTDENWKRIDKLLESIPDSDFLRFCFMNDIVEKGINSCNSYEELFESTKGSPNTFP